MSNITIEVPVNIDTIIQRLTIKEKIELVKKLERMTIGKRIDDLLSKIDARSKEFPISEREINNVVKEVSKELYGKGSR